MHVRELPHKVFNGLVIDRLTVRPRQHARSAYPHLNERELADISDEPVVIGETVDGPWLRVSDYKTFTRLTAFDTADAAVVNHDWDGFMSVGAGNIDTGVWKYGGGNQQAQTVWVDLGTGERQSIGAERIEQFARRARFMGRVATTVTEMMASGLFEESYFFPGDAHQDGLEPS